MLAKLDRPDQEKEKIKNDHDPERAIVNAWHIQES